MGTHVHLYAHRAECMQVLFTNVYKPTDMPLVATSVDLYVST